MKKGLRGLHDLVGQDVVVRLDRKPIDKYKLDGFVVGLSDDWLLIHQLDGNTLLLVGYAAVRTSDINRFEIDRTFVTRALKLCRRTPVIPEGIDLSSLPALLESVNERYPLFMIECEKRWPGTAFIGKIAQMKHRKVMLKKLDTKAKWIENEAFHFRDITQIEFGDGYTTTLAALEAYESGLHTDIL